VYALYGRSQYIFRFLAWAFVAEHATMILFTVLTARTIHWFGMCAPDHISMTSIGIGCVLGARPGVPTLMPRKGSRLCCTTRSCSD
jgi:hypothetical protein